MEGRREVIDEEEALKLQGQAYIWECMLSFAHTSALKCAVELRIADIIHSHGCPITLSQIASSIASPSRPADITCLSRIMRFLVRKKIFTVTSPSDGAEPLYGLTHSSKWLLHDDASELSLIPIMETGSHPSMMASFSYLSRCVREGGTAFKKAHGHEIWDHAAVNPEFNKIFNHGMGCTARITTRAIVSGYKDGFERIGSLVDVGGGTGAATAEIVGAFPHIRGINFDLPHVIATAPEYPGVAHIGGDMFEAIPTADVVLMMWILHDWGDEDCVKILKNCRRAIAERTGKVIIVDLVLDLDGKGLFDTTALVFDLLMLANSPSGKERTELEWSKLLQAGGFPRYNILKIPALPSIIEAYPQ